MLKPKAGTVFNQRSASQADDYPQTREQLLERRRKESLSVLQRSFGDLSKQKMMVALEPARPQSVCAANRGRNAAANKTNGQLAVAKSQ